MKAIIIGAGIAGLAAALSLHRSGWDVVLVEHAPQLRNGGYMIDFFGPGFEAAERLGLLPELRRRAHDVDDLDWVDGGGRVRARLNYKRMQRALDGRLLSLLRGDIEQVLYEAVRDKVELRFSTSVDGFSQDDGGVRVRLSDGSELDAELLVGADGIHSRVRALAFGDETQFLRPLGYETAAYFFDDAAARRALGSVFAVANEPGRLAGFYAADERRLATFFAWASTDASPAADPRQRLAQVFGDIGWLVPAALADAPPASEIYYDTVAQVEMPRWHDGRVVMIGDAAYAVSLVAGQGASLALAGGAALGEALAGSGEIAPALATLEARLRPLVLQKQRGGRRMAKWFVPDSRLRIALRNLAFHVMNMPVFAGLLSPLFALDSKGFVSREGRPQAE